ncbi:MAG: hypothetical protein AAGC55_19560 [Myxococcota bacterium]
MRYVIVLFALLSLCLPAAIELSTVDAQSKRSRAKKKGATQSKAKGNRGQRRGQAKGQSKGQKGQAKGQPKGQKKGDPNKVQRFSFTGLDLEGQMRAPQLLYFLDRANEELQRASLERRSFIPEMVRSIDEEAL